MTMTDHTHSAGNARAAVLGALALNLPTLYWAAVLPVSTVLIEVSPAMTPSRPGE